MYLGNAYIGKQDYDKAIEEYNKAIAIRPIGLAYTNRGLAHAKKAQYSKAIEDYNLAVDIDPTYSHNYYGRGAIFWEKGDIDKAIPNFKKACDLGDKDGCDALQKALKKR